MRDFIDDLDQRLRVAAAYEADHAPVPAARRRKTRRRPALLAGATATLATVGAVFALTTPSFADLPILQTPTTDATGIRGQSSVARRAGVDFSSAHAFRTPAGPGYVFLTADRRTLCLSIPQEGAYGGECAPVATVERQGLDIELAGDRSVDPAATSLAVFVLPEGVDQAMLIRDGGASAAASVTSGIVATELTAPAELRWEQDGRTARHRFDGPFKAVGGPLVSCPDGRMVEGPASAAGAGSGLSSEARRRLCR